MSAFWSTWVVALAVITLGIALFLFFWGLRVKIPQEPDGTTGHVWAHGVLREAVRPLPKWWIVFSLGVFAAVFGYLYLYPGMGSYAGALGWTSHEELARDAAANQAKLDPLVQRVAQGSIEQLADDPEVQRLGQRLFVDNCAACHGSGGHGNFVLGAPSLTDTDWVYGGDGDAILASILDGRRGVMPPFTPTFNASSTEELAHFVLSLSGADHDPLKAARGKPQFGLCAACHLADGKGNPALGAPDLTNEGTLYGDDVASIVNTISHGRTGVMPPWRARLSEPDAKATAAWVYAQSNGKAGAH